MACTCSLEFSLFTSKKNINMQCGPLRLFGLLGDSVLYLDLLLSRGPFFGAVITTGVAPLLQSDRVFLLK